MKFTKYDKDILRRTWEGQWGTYLRAGGCGESPEEVVHLSLGAVVAGVENRIGEGFVRQTMGGKVRTVMENSETFAEGDPDEDSST